MGRRPRALGVLMLIDFFKTETREVHFSTYLQQYLTVPDSTCIYRQYIKKYMFIILYGC